MATRNIVPRANGEGGIGTPAKHWGNGYFDNLSLAGEDVAGTLSNMDLALAESTGYGIVSGCTPTISGLTVTVAAGVVHLAGGTRKEIEATNITLDAADTTNPRIDLVYITSAGVVAKVTGTAAASPSAPALPIGGISVATVSVAAGATTGTVTDSRGMLNKKIFNVGDFEGSTTEDKLHNALSTITEGMLFCGDVTITKSFDVASNVTDYRRVQIVGANITISSVPMFVSSKPDSQASIDNSVPSFSNCYIKGNNSTMLFGAFNVITTKFDNCKIVACPLFNSPTHYMQSLFFNNTDILTMNADMVTALRLYNFNMANTRIEYGSGKLFVLAGENGNAIVNGAITNSLIEGRSDKIIETGGGFAPLVIENCYFEGNSYPYIDMINNGGPAQLNVRGCYFNIEELLPSQRLFTFNNSRNSAVVLIEDNNFVKTAVETDTLYITDAPSQISMFKRKIYNRFNYQGNIEVMQYDTEILYSKYYVALEDSNLVVTIPLNKKSILWLTNLVIEVDFFGTKLNGGSVVVRDYINAKFALICQDTNTKVSPVKVSEFKTNNSTAVTATITDNAYNAKNCTLKLSFSGFDITNYTYDVCFIRNNNSMSFWDY